MKKIISTCFFFALGGNRLCTKKTRLQLKQKEMENTMHRLKAKKCGDNLQAPGYIVIKLPGE